MKCPFSRTPTSLDSCVWHINHPESGNCFWVWVQNHSDGRGEMTPPSQSKIFSLLGIPTSQAATMVEQALIELKKKLGKKEDWE